MRSKNRQAWYWDRIYQTDNVMDNIVYEKNADGKIEAVGSELGSFSVGI